jgi:hypothetical protein
MGSNEMAFESDRRLDDRNRELLERLERTPFPKLFNWLMENGLRPQSVFGKSGLPWTESELAAELCTTYNRLYRSKKDDFEMTGEESIRKNLQNWRQGKTACRQAFWRPLELVFLGEGTNRTLDKLRIILRRALQQNWDARKSKAFGQQYGKQITSEKLLRQVYSFDEFAYFEDGSAGGDDIPYSLFKEWWAAYPPGFLYSTTKSTNLVSAVTGMFPVPKKWALEFLDRKTDEFGLSGELIGKAREFDPPLYWYFSGLAAEKKQTLTSLRSHLPNILGFSMLVWLRDTRQSIVDRTITIVSEGSTMLGERLLSDHFGFPIVAPSIADTKPRFRKTTSVAQIKNILLKDKFFKHCLELHEAVKLEFDEP